MHERFRRRLLGERYTLSGHRYFICEDSCMNEQEVGRRVRDGLIGVVRGTGDVLEATVKTVTGVAKTALGETASTASAVTEVGVGAGARRDPRRRRRWRGGRRDGCHEHQCVRGCGRHGRRQGRQHGQGRRDRQRARCVPRPAWRASVPSKRRPAPRCWRRPRSALTLRSRLSARSRARSRLRKTSA